MTPPRTLEIDEREATETVILVESLASRGVEPADDDDMAEAVTNRLGLLASAIAGRRVSVLLTDTDLAHSDGETIFLLDGDVDDQMVALVAQSSLLALDSLDPSIAIRLVGRATPARRYVTLEVARALGDRRIPIPRRFRAALSLWDGPVSGSASESLDLALESHRIPPCPDSFGTIRPRKVLSGGGGAGLISALARKPRDGRQKTIDVPELEDDEDSDESKVLKLFSSAFQMENPLFKMLRDQMGMGRRPKPDNDDGGMELPIGGASAVSRVGENAQLMVAPPDMDLSVTGHQAGDHWYPEWDSNRSSYRPHYCAVGEFVPADSTPDETFNPRTDLELRRRLASLGLAYERHRHLADGDGIDVAALVEFAVSRARGETPDDHVYQARLKTAHDLGVIVLLDASGSTAQRTNGIPIWNQHRQLASNLVGALEQVGDRVAAFGFNSRGRRHVRFLLIKDFEHRFDAACRRRLASLEPSGFTRLGTAIRHATHVVSEQAGTANRLIVVVSDGFAYDDGYQGAYAENDTRRALEEAVALGVGCVCVSIASDTRQESLDRLWGSITHVQLDDAADLSKHVVPMIQAALKAASGTTRDIGRRGIPSRAS